ncbi:murein peptide amidase A [Poriferisphaera corsica]|uniref:Murein peptide amidase A n=1 Tax=Poriferisphaera corsica TaxID=2528020 RepID=A0A517YYF3_9BACT|nr:DUF2817 domain-containing protein [Poriferisphaera corsica]QDU35249.1 murein peptide amidase A [Poriferisphaera corsica]
MKSIYIAIFALCLTSLFGCAVTPSPPLVSSTIHRTDQILGRSIQDRPISATTLTDTTATSPDTVLLVCGIHGNEAAATPAFWRLIGFLEQNPALLKDRSVIIVPALNPDGIAAKQRFNANGIDLNRNFGANNRKNSNRYGREALSEPESQILHDLILNAKPDRIIMMHQPLKCIDYDGPAQPLAEHMGKFTSLPVKKLGSRPGSLGSWAGNDLNIPIITFELHRDANSIPSIDIWDRYIDSILAAITFPDDPTITTTGK